MYPQFGVFHAVLEIGKNICNTVKDTNATDERLQGSIATVAAAQAAALTDILSECGDKGMAEVPTDWLDGLDRRAVEVGALVLQQFEGPIQEEVGLQLTHWQNIHLKTY